MLQWKRCAARSHVARPHPNSTRLQIRGELKDTKNCVLPSLIENCKQLELVFETIDSLSVSNRGADCSVCVVANKSFAATVSWPTRINTENASAPGCRGAKSSRISSTKFASAVLQIHGKHAASPNYVVTRSTVHRTRHLALHSLRTNRKCRRLRSTILTSRGF